MLLKLCYLAEFIIMVLKNDGCRGYGSPAVVAALGPVLYPVTKMFAIGQFPCPWHGKDLGIFLPCEQSPGLVGGTTRISDHHALTDPCRAHKILPPLPKQDVLVPTALRIDQASGHRDSKTLPTRDQPHYLEAKSIRLMLPVAGAMAQPFQHRHCWTSCQNVDP